LAPKGDETDLRRRVTESQWKPEYVDYKA